ncbi:hypothetical protein [Pseudomonas putida]|uniref:Uncharacterized protein n=1 Tax=Pseudomonas putida TaxID=303 RepID=A0A8I1EAV1_PSEPU|nr:hypothetical protein [Pseudomonas putida]MBI6882582.1 hypothetical protein [Pseudomonas putida]
MSAKPSHILANLLERIKSCDLVSNFTQLEVSYIDFDIDHAELFKCIDLMNELQHVEMRNMIGVFPEIFESLAKISINILDSFECKGIDPSLSKYKSTVIFGSRLFSEYTQLNGSNLKLSHELSERIKVFKGGFQPSWLGEAIIKFHRRAFDRFDLETLLEISRKADEFKLAFKNDARALNTYLFTNQDHFASSGYRTNPFLSVMLMTAMPMHDRETTKESFDRYSNIKKGLDRLSDRLDKVKEAGIKLACSNVDVLLIGQLIDLFRLAYEEAEIQDERIKYIKSASNLIDMMDGIDFSEPLSPLRNIYRQRAGGLGWLDVSTKSLLLKCLSDTMKDWRPRSPFSDSMRSFERIVLESSIKAFDGQSEELSTGVKSSLAALFKNSKKLILNRQFHDHLGKNGRILIARNLSGVNDDKFKVDFLRNCKEARGYVIESDLGI